MLQKIIQGSLLPNKGDKMGRKEAREQAFKLVFEYAMNNEKNETPVIIRREVIINDDNNTQKEQAKIQ